MAVKAHVVVQNGTTLAFGGSSSLAGNGGRARKKEVAAFRHRHRFCNNLDNNED